MTVLVKDLLDRARILLQDSANVRWPLVELTGWFNDGQREIVLNKPNACSKTALLSLVAGTLQKIPDNYVSVIRFVRNIDNPIAVAAGGRIIYTVPRDELDASYPTWHTMAQVKSVKCVAYDQADTRAFYTYPPNNGTGYIEAVLAAIPQEIAIPAGDVTDLDLYTSPIGLDDIYANTILDYGLYRAYLKDAAIPNSAQLSSFHYQQFANAVGIKYRGELMANPNQPNPTTGVSTGQNSAGAA